MATSTDQNAVVASAASTIAALDAKVAGLIGDVTKAKAQVVAALQAHVAAHNADIAKHAAEVAAAEALIAQANPTATVKADTAAAYVLTSGSAFQGVVNFVGRNWRYAAVAGALGIVAFGKFVLHI